MDTRIKMPTIRPIQFLSIVFAFVWNANLLTAAESNIQVQLHLQESTTIAERVYNGNSAQLMLNGYNLNHIGIASVNGTKIELRRDQPETTVELRFEGSLPSVCRIQAGDASMKFLASPGQFYVCNVVTTQSPTPPVVPDLPGDPQISPAACDENPEADSLKSDLKTLRKEDKRLKAEECRLKNELAEADARKRNFEAYKVEIADLARKRDAIIAIQGNSWILRKKDGGVMDLADPTLSSINLALQTQLQLAIAGIETRNREVEKLGPLINGDNTNAKDIHYRLKQISEGRMSLERRRAELKKSIP